MKIILSIVSVLLLAGCAVVPVAVSTPSGRPEVFIAGANTDQVKSVIINYSLSKGWRLYQDTPYEVSFSHPFKNFAAIALYGSQFNGIPDLRVRFTITSINGGVQVFSDGEIISNPGSGFEHDYPLEDADKNAFVQLQVDLETIKSQVSGNSQVHSPVNAQPRQTSNSSDSSQRNVD